MSSLKVARLWTKLDGSVRCGVCENRCEVSDGSTGICGNYLNIGGTLYHLGYGRLSAVESRPIEIKPLFHYWPNSTALTFSTWGCNFYCPWCQNYHLSFRKPKESDEVVSIDELLRMAKVFGDEGFSASFNEPTVNYDYILDLTSRAVKDGFYVMMVTNGYLTKEALEELVLAGVDGWSIDIKGCPQMRKALPKVDHTVVFRNAKTILDLGGHVEMVYLVVTNTNDFNECVDWVIDNHLKFLGPKTPLHVNRYYPAHMWREPPTPTDKLLRIANEARKAGIEFVYVGNIHNPDLESTKCPKCGKVLIVRDSYRVTEFYLDSSCGRWRCPRCGYEVPIRGRYIPHKKYYFL